MVEEDRIARQIADRRQTRERNAQLASTRRRVSLDDLDKALAAGEVESLNLIIKGDVSGSVEALEDALVKIDVGDEEVSLRVIGRGVGAITENDINLAVASKAVVIGFNVRPEGKAREAAEREGVDVRYYTIIYQAIDEVEAALKGMLKPEYEEVQLGTAEVREVFRVPRIGNVAGSLVRSGTIRRNTQGAAGPRRHRRRRQPDGRVAAPVQGRRDRGPRGLRVRYRARLVQRHQDRRRDRDVRAAREAAHASSVVVGTLVVDIVLGDVASLKQKRSVVRPIVAELRRRFEVAAAETGQLELHRRAEISVGGGRSTHAHAVSVLESCERLVAGRPEITLLSARQRVLDDDDLD